MSYAANAYAKTSRSVLTPREAESAVLTKAAQRLQMIRDDCGEPIGRARRSAELQPESLDDPGDGRHRSDEPTAR